MSDDAAVRQDPEARIVPERVRSLPDTPGILGTTDAPFELSPAQRVNLVPPTAWGYEPLWRGRSIAILTAGAYSTTRELDLLLEWVAVSDRDAVLDAGCSAGLYARTLKRVAPGAEIHAVDVSLAFLREALRRAHEEDMRLHLLQADVEDLPYRDGAFDAVVSGGSLNEFRNPANALRELARVLRPGGRMFLMYTMRSARTTGRFVQDALSATGLCFPTAATVDAWAAAAGLEPIHAEHHRPIGLALYRKPDPTGAHAGPR